MSLYSIPLVNQSIDRNQSRQLMNFLGRNFIFQGIAFPTFLLTVTGILPKWEIPITDSVGQFLQSTEQPRGDWIRSESRLSLFRWPGLLARHPILLHSRVEIALEIRALHQLPGWGIRGDLASDLIDGILHAHSPRKIAISPPP